MKADTEGKVRLQLSRSGSVGGLPLTSKPDHHLQGCYRMGGRYVASDQSTAGLRTHTSDKPLSIEDVEVAPPKEGEVRIKIL